ncbi:hypothetical protein [Nocardia arthritidis]|uniref:Uncharacterized protein n=1 Tax=Nocardia arthritidis TaxID=228602 RepID=A0A6G9YC10_9NOCA|nr:hypothetical protein [Nocardia arthritidis]QIS10596.1 hypothetical protein F5544_13535 [Nocardia arthritidis]
MSTVDDSVTGDEYAGLAPEYIEMMRRSVRERELAEQRAEPEAGADRLPVHGDWIEFTDWEDQQGPTGIVETSW